MNHFSCFIGLMHALIECRAGKLLLEDIGKPEEGKTLCRRHYVAHEQNPARAISFSTAHH